MTQHTGREPANDPQQLEQFLVERQRQGDIEGMVALFEPEAILDPGEGKLVQGTAAIRALFTELVESGEKLELGRQSPAIINGDLALTSVQVADGSVTSEVARRQPDGSWLWVIDKYSVIPD